VINIIIIVIPAVCFLLAINGFIVSPLLDRRDRRKGR